jgi:uncharacterized protein (TIGR02594 family)
MHLKTTKMMLAMCSVALVSLTIPASARPDTEIGYSAGLATSEQHQFDSRNSAGFGTHRATRRELRAERRAQRTRQSTDRRSVARATSPAMGELTMNSDGRYLPTGNGAAAGREAFASVPPVEPHSGRRKQVATATATSGVAGGFGMSGVVEEARRYIGGNPTGRSALWCARFMNMVLERSGHQGSGSDMARSFASYGQRISGPQVGAIAVMSRGKRGGHVGVVSGIDASGNPIIISGNHGRRVAESTYSRGRIYAYVMPQ